MGAAVSRVFDELDTVLLGRVTYTGWAGYWPTSTDEPVASCMNSTPKYVASSTLESVDEWQNSELIKGRSPTSSPSSANERAGRSAPAAARRWCASLLEADLLDELTLFIHPVVAGGGRQRLFAPTPRWPNSS